MCSLMHVDAAAQLAVLVQQKCFLCLMRAQATKILKINESSPVRLRKQLIPVATLKLPGDDLKGQLSFPFLTSLHLQSLPSQEF